MKQDALGNITDELRLLSNMRNRLAASTPSQIGISIIHCQHKAVKEA
jgi:hypothetical protein